MVGLEHGGKLLVPLPGIGAAELPPAVLPDTRPAKGLLHLPAGRSRRGRRRGDQCKVVLPVPAAPADRALLGDNPIRIRRSGRGMTMRQPAEAAGLSLGCVSNIESGRSRRNDGFQRAAGPAGRGTFYPSRI